ncbi:MAG: hypothetical protein HQK75_08695 [Candidatus Magnetomorum sp.]|nr:hypothetical protein [Candidatus Magnetomorum sp.]
MNIQNINAVSQPEKSTRQKSTDAHSTEFQSYLDAFSEKIQDNPVNVKPSGNVCSVQTVPFIKMPEPHKEMVAKVNSVLDLFETYSNDLHDSNKTLKEIEPVLLNMKQATEKLYKENALNAEAGNTLSQLINNLQVTASVEYFKFQRGDYL